MASVQGKAKTKAVKLFHAMVRVGPYPDCEIVREQA